MTNVEENPNEIASQILKQYLEEKSFGFIKEVCNNILSVFDNNILTETEIKSYNTIQEKLSELHQFVADYCGGVSLK